MRAILPVWTLINIPDNVITADTGTEVPGSRLASHYPEAAQDPGSGSDPYHGDHETKPRHQNLQTAMIWEHCEARGDYYWDYWSYHRAAIIQATQHNIQCKMRAAANETQADAAHWYSHLIVRIRQTMTRDLRQSKLKSQTEIVITGNMPENDIQ